MLFNKQNHKTKKKYDIIFYNRNHPTKHSLNTKKILTKLSEFCKICVIGDFFDQKNVKNFGWVKRNKAYSLIKKSKFSFNSAENFLSIFGIDCVNHGTPVIYDKNTKCALKFSTGHYIGISLTKIKAASIEILKLLQKFKTHHKFKAHDNISIEKKNIKKFLFLYFLR